MKTIKCQFCKRLAQHLLECGIRAELDLIKTKDKDAPRRYYRQAAVLGNRQAQVFLAYYYAANSVHSNRRLAIAWFKRAARAGEELCTLVSPESILDVDKQIQRFKTLIRP